MWVFIRLLTVWVYKLLFHIFKGFNNIQYIDIYGNINYKFLKSCFTTVSILFYCWLSISLKGNRFSYYCLIKWKIKLILDIRVCSIVQINYFVMYLTLNINNSDCLIHIKRFKKKDSMCFYYPIILKIYKIRIWAH